MPVSINSMFPMPEPFTLSRSDHSDRGPVDIDLYTLKFKNPELQIRTSTEYLVENNKPYTGPFTDPYYSYQIKRTRRIFPAGTRVTYENALHYAIPVGKANTHTFFGLPVKCNQTPGQMNILRISVGQQIEALPERDTYWVLTDQYGKEHRISFTAKSSGNLIDFTYYVPPVIAHHNP